MTPTHVVILGTGGLGRETLWGARLMAGVEVLGLLTSESAEHGSELSGVPVLGDEDWLSAHPDVEVACAVGNPRERRQVAQRLQAGRTRFATLVHPSAQIAEAAKLGAGSIVGARAVITTQVAIGEHAVIGAGAIVSHDCVLEDFATLSPGATLAGLSRVDEAAEIGPGAILGRGARVGRGAVVGANSLVLGHVPPNLVVIGSPAREIRRFEGDDVL